jgi:hypothetical protein
MRFLSLPWGPLEGAFADHGEIAGREVRFSLATCDPGLDVLGAVIDNRAHTPLWLNGALDVGRDAVVAGSWIASFRGHLLLQAGEAL